MHKVFTFVLFLDLGFKISKKSLQILLMDVGGSNVQKINADFVIRFKNIVEIIS